MTDDQKIDESIDESDESQDERSRVVRDASFVKLYADRVIAQDLGRDVELCLIQFGQPLTHYVSSDTDISVEVSDCVTEAGRVRIAWPTAVTLAMNIMSQGIDNGLVRGNKIIENLQERIDAQQGKGAADGD